jgi:transcriptional regulator with XRE-family HTH domain
MARTEKTHPLFHWRKQHGDRSLQSLADEIGCTQSFLSQIELGEKQPSLGMAARLHRATELPMEAFLKGEVA